MLDVQTSFSFPVLSFSVLSQCLSQGQWWRERVVGLHDGGVYLAVNMYTEYSVVISAFFLWVGYDAVDCTVDPVGSWQWAGAVS